MSIPNARGPLGGTGTRAECHGQIYGEASCQPDDVLYQGSEDEDYDDPQIRQQKCEDAARRYLEGHVPLLISASLRGPFHKESGWQNPWRSKARTSSIRSTLATTHGPPNQQSPSLQADESIEIPETLDCHLPSPESLKQAPFTESHPFLTQGTLAVVQEWRKTISPTSSSDKNSLAASQMAEPAGKRKRANSKGLKKMAAKRKKVEIISHGSSDESVCKNRTISSDPPRSNVISVSSLLNGSFDNRLRDFRNPSTEPNETQNDIGETDRDEELSPSPAISVRNKSSSPCKRLLSKRKLGQAPSDPSQHCDDELGPTKEVAFSPSSPVSQKCNSRSSPIATDPNGTDNEANQRSGDTEMDHSSPLSSHIETRTGVVSEIDAEMAVSSGDDMDLETQQDHSFAYKLIRPKRAKTSVESLSTSESTSERLDDSDESGNAGTLMGNLDGKMNNEMEVEQALSEKQPPEHGVTRIPHNANLSDGPHKKSEQDVRAENRASVDASPKSSGLQHRDDDLENPISMTSQIERDGNSHNQSSPVQQPMVRHGKAEGHADASPSRSTDTSSSEAVEALEAEAAPTHQPAVIQEKPFSIKSLLNSCVSPLRKLSRLGGPSSSHGGLNRDSSVPETATAQSSDQGVLEPDSVISLQQYALKTMEKLEMEKALQESVKIGTECIQPPSSADVRDTSPPLAISRLLTTDDTGASQNRTPKTGHGILSLSQQSPWIPSHSSQQATTAGTPASPHGDKFDGENVIQKGKPVSDAAIPVEAQSPWTRETETPSTLRRGILGITQTDAMTSPSVTQEKRMSSPSGISDESKSRSVTQGKTARPSTPEPQFSTASFASFMTPSPERRSRPQKQRVFKDASYQSILASAMKNPWKSVKSDRRVSWALLPNETESPCGMRQSSHNADSLSSFSSNETRPASPPPRTPISNIPVSENTRFRGHFAAMANRSGTFGQNLRAASQQKGYSPDAEAMEENYDEDGGDDGNGHGTTEILMKDTPSKGGKTPAEQSHASGGEDSQDPMDIVDDLFNELGDFLQTWDIDAELDAARKVDGLGVSSRLGIEAHGPL